MNRKEIIDLLENTNANDITLEDCDKIIHLLKEMKEKTNFEKIYEFNTAFGVKSNNTPQ